MKKRFFVLGTVILLMLTFYTVVFSNSYSDVGYMDILEADPLKGERFVYGSILNVDYANKELTIEQYMDDNSIKVNSTLKAYDDVVIILKRNDKCMNIDFEDLKVGDQFGLILDRHGLIRGIIISV